MAIVDQSNERVNQVDWEVRGNQAEEVRQLCREYRVSPDKMREAVRAVGYDGNKLREYLKEGSGKS